MAIPALRVFACAGALATGVLLAGTGIPTSLADTDETGGGGAAAAEGTTAPHGAGETPDEGPKPDGTPGDGSPADEVLIPSMADVLGAMSQPEPEPTPGPAFRTQQEAPVIDSTPGDGGGIDQVDGGADGPPLFEVPLVVAPPMPVGAGARTSPVGGSATRAPLIPAGAQPAVAGARAPLIRGSLPPSGQTMTRSLNQANGQPTQVGYPRYLRNPTVGELSAIALPGVAGLMFLTFSGGAIGYRQANSARFVRTSAAERFLP